MNKIKHLCCLSFLSVVLATACQPDKPAEEQEREEVAAPAQQDTTFADTLLVVEEEVTIITPPEEAVTSPPPQKESPTQPRQEKPRPQQQAPAPPQKPAGANEGLQETTYQLERVQGEPLPLVLDMTTDCDTKLQRGTLSMNNGRFQFQSLSTVECEGQTTRQERHEATGTYRLEDNRIYLNVESGEVLGDAVGIVENNTIRLQQISNDAEQQEVDWLFRQQ